MCKFLPLLLILCITTSSLVSKADDAYVFPLKKDVPSLSNGVGMSTKAAAIVIATLEANKILLEAAIKKEADDQQAKCEFKIAELQSKSTADLSIKQSMIDNQNNQIDILEKSIKKLENNNNINPWNVAILSGGAGLLLGVIVSVSIAIAAK